MKYQWKVSGGYIPISIQLAIQMPHWLVNFQNTIIYTLNFYAGDDILTKNDKLMFKKKLNMHGWISHNKRNKLLYCIIPFPFPLQ